MIKWQKIITYLNTSLLRNISLQLLYQEILNSSQNILNTTEITSNFQLTNESLINLPNLLNNPIIFEHSLNGKNKSISGNLSDNDYETALGLSLFGVISLAALIPPPIQQFFIPIRSYRSEYNLPTTSPADAKTTTAANNSTQDCVYNQTIIPEFCPAQIESKGHDLRSNKSQILSIIKIGNDCSCAVFGLKYFIVLKIKLLVIGEIKLINY